MPSLKVKRGTRAQLNAAVTATQLKEGEPYLITDEKRLAIGLSTSTFESVAKFSEIGSSQLFGSTLADGTTLTVATHGNRRLPVNGGTINLPADASWPTDVVFEFVSVGTTPTAIAWTGNTITSQDTGALASQVIGGAVTATAIVTKMEAGSAYLYAGSARGIDAIAITLGTNPNTPAVGLTDNYNFVSAAGLIVQGLYQFSGITGSLKVTAIVGNTVTLENVSATANATVAAGTKLAPAGSKGETGAAGAAGAAGTNGTNAIATIAGTSPPITPGTGLTANYTVDSSAGLILLAYYALTNINGVFQLTNITGTTITLLNVNATVGTTVTVGMRLGAAARPIVDYSPVAWRSGSDITIAVNSISLTTTAQGAGSLRAFHWVLRKAVTINAIRQEVTALVAGATFRLGIYTDTGALYPGSLIANSDTIAFDAATTGVKVGTPAANITLNPGSYFLAINNSGAPTLRTIPITGLSAALGYLPTGGTNSSTTGWAVASAFGALPATYPAGATLSSFAAPATMFRVV